MSALTRALLSDLDDQDVDMLVELLAPRLRPVDEPEPWIGVEAAAEHLACGRSRIYALVSAKRIPHSKDASRLLFKRSELDEWVSGGGGIRP